MSKCLDTVRVPWQIWVFTITPGVWVGDPLAVGLPQQRCAAPRVYRGRLGDREGVRDCQVTWMLLSLFYVAK